MKPKQIGVDRMTCYDVEPRTGKPFGKLGYKSLVEPKATSISVNRMTSDKRNLPVHDANDTKDGNWQDNIGVNINLVD